MARPRHLPEFNPWVPQIIADSYPDLHKMACECVRKTVATEKFHGLYWLKFYNKLLKAIAKKKLAPLASLSKEESAALSWAHHKGKWDWDEKANRRSKPKSKKPRRVAACEKEKRKEAGK